MTHGHIQATCCSDKILCFHIQRYVAGTCSKDTGSKDKVTLRTHKHVPMCEQHMILWLQHVAATCLCVMTPHVRGAFKKANGEHILRSHYPSGNVAFQGDPYIFRLEYPKKSYHWYTNRIVRDFLVNTLFSFYKNSVFPDPGWVFLFFFFFAFLRLKIFLWYS